MISLLLLNKLKKLLFFFTILFFYTTLSNAANESIDIWGKKENNREQNNQIDNNKKEISIKSPILSSDINKITIDIDEKKLDKSKQTIFGLFDPQKIMFSVSEHRLDLSDRAHTLPHWLTHQLHRS